MLHLSLPLVQYKIKTLLDFEVPKHMNLSRLLQTVVLFLQTTHSLCSPYVSGAEPSKQLTVAKLVHK